MTEPIHDLDLTKDGWKASCAELWTDSLWRIDQRDRSGAHSGTYHGNFVPQIPRQLIRRFTRPGDWVLDPFLGSGTTLIEAQRLGRSGVGIELQPDVAQRAWAAIDSERSGPEGPAVAVEVGDAISYDYEGRLAALGCPGIQLAILHPPYHDIIRFSEDEADLSTLEYSDFLDHMQDLIAALDPVVKLGGHVVLVMGDKYEKGEWVPMGWETAERIRHFSHDREPGAHAGTHRVGSGGGPYTLKSVVVKDMQNSRAKQGQEGIWRYRALKGGFYVFKHEYIYLFQKTRPSFD